MSKSDAEIARELADKIDEVLLNDLDVHELRDIAKLIEAAIEAETDRCCAIVFGQCSSDNVAQRTVDAIRTRSTIYLIS